MATQVWGPVRWRGSVDAEGHRSYVMTHKVRGDITDGPANVLQTPGLPLPGSIWQLLGDVDVWAWCRAERTVTPIQDDEPGNWWLVESTFSTKPPDARQSRCQDVRIEDPLLEPMKVSGSSVRYTEEATHDRFGAPIVNSAWEQLRGQQNEWDANRHQVKVEQNVPFLQLDLVTSMMNTLNDAPMWGKARRCVKLSEFNWERLYYGTCYTYYKRLFTFEVDARTWDRDLLDEGTKALNGHWDPDTGEWVLDLIAGEFPDPTFPADFARVVDKSGNPMKVILDGYGVPYDPRNPPTQAIAGSVDNPGSDYTVGNILTLTGGSYTNQAKIRVASVAANGGVVNFSLYQGGRYTVPPSNPVATTVNTGSGSGATFNITFGNPSGPGVRHTEVYNESNFLLLGLPLIL